MVDVDESLNPLIAKNPFILKGQRWKTLRQKLAPSLSPARVKATFPLLPRVCEDFNNYMKNQQKEDIDVHKVCGYFTSEVVAKVAFGLDGNIFNNPNSEFYKFGSKLWSGTFYNPLFMILTMYFPIINTILRRGFVPTDVAEFFTTIIKQAANYRQKNPDKVPDNDYLQFLLNLRTKDPDFTLEDVVAQGLTFFTDGFETSSLMATYMIYELTVNPGVQEDLRKDLKGMETFSYENIMALPLLDRVMQETLRKYSVVALSKECTNDTVLQVDNFSCSIKKGTHISIPAYGIHHNPEIYPDPEKFDPDRFLTGNVKTRHPMAHLVFGAGPRICIGNKFATFQIKALLANILTQFKLVKCGKTVEPLKMDLKHTMPVPEKDIFVRFQAL